MKSLKYILAISGLLALGLKAYACGYWEYEPGELNMVRVCERPDDYDDYDIIPSRVGDADAVCRLWQSMTMPGIPVKDIHRVVFDASLSEMKDLSGFSRNKFAQWLGSHPEDYSYLLLAKEVEELRERAKDPWYYPYDGDELNVRFDSILNVCDAYAGKRLAAQHALQAVRIHMTRGEYAKCVDLWQNKVAPLPRNVIKEMIASYVGGAYQNLGDAEAAERTFTLARDAASLMVMKLWNSLKQYEKYQTPKVRKLAYLVDKCPKDKCIGYLLQSMVENIAWQQVDEKDALRRDLIALAPAAAQDGTSLTPAAWYYALSVAADDYAASDAWLKKAESARGDSYIKESIRAQRLWLMAHNATPDAKCLAALQRELEWLNACMKRDMPKDLDEYGDVPSDNVNNYSFYFWQDAMRKIVLSEACPALCHNGGEVQALQLANYAINHFFQIFPAYTQGYYDRDTGEWVDDVLTVDQMRHDPNMWNDLDYCNDFIRLAMTQKADAAAEYAQRLQAPLTPFDLFIRAGSYADPDYIADIVGTLYVREQDYAKAAEWFGTINDSYWATTNYGDKINMRLDPFVLQDMNHGICKCKRARFKYNFAIEMCRAAVKMHNADDPNDRAAAKLRYAMGMRNSFGRCWPLTVFGISGFSGSRWAFDDDPMAAKAYAVSDSLSVQALKEFTDPEQAAKAHLMLKNYRTIMQQYPSTAVGRALKGRCDTWRDYSPLYL